MVPSNVDAEVIVVAVAGGPLAINDATRTRGANAMETAGVDMGDAGSVDADADPGTTDALIVAGGGALIVAGGGALCVAAGALCDDDQG